MNHVFKECSCGEHACMFCDGGLSYCLKCRGFEGSLTEDCCGNPLTEDTLSSVYKEEINFVNGIWVRYDDDCVIASYRTGNQNVTQDGVGIHIFHKRTGIVVTEQRSHEKHINKRIAKMVLLQKLKHYKQQ